MRAGHAAAEVNPYHHCEAPAPGLRFETAGCRFGGGDGEVDAEADEEVHECLWGVILVGWGR